MIAPAVIHFASRREPYRRGGLALSRLVQPFEVHLDGEQLISDANLLALLDDPVVIIKLPGEGDVLRDLPDDERREVADRFREKLAEQAEFDAILIPDALGPDPATIPVGSADQAQAGETQMVDPAADTAGAATSVAESAGTSEDLDASGQGSGDATASSAETKENNGGADQVPAPVATKPQGRKVRG